MLLYIHVPFCRAKCRYCAFYSRPVFDARTLDAWTDAIAQDMTLWGEKLRTSAGSQPVTSIFFGGGTPSLLSPEQIGRLLDHAAREFAVCRNAEISMEANPESMTQEKAYGFRSAGVNRVSLGVQALDDSLLHSIGRIHSKSEAVTAFKSLRRAQLHSVGLDFIWGLPGETLESWRTQLETAIALHPDHLSCYGLTLEEGTPMWNERDSLLLPDETEQAAMYMSCGEILEKNGYTQYEISNFAQPDYECRHNMGYWLGEEYLGLGPSAVSAIKGLRWSQPADFDAWLKSPRGERPDEELCEKLTFREQAEELVMLRLRTARGLALNEYHSFTGRDFAADNKHLLDALQSEGLARVTEGPEPRFALSRSGMLISNAIIEQCFENIPDVPEHAH